LLIALKRSVYLLDAKPTSKVGALYAKMKETFRVAAIDVISVVTVEQ